MGFFPQLTAPSASQAALRPQITPPKYDTDADFIEFYF